LESLTTDPCDLAAVTADIPAGLIAGEPREPVRVQGRPPMSKTAEAGISVAVAAAAPAVLSLVIGPLAFVMFAPFYLMGLLVAGAQILFTRYDKRSCKQLPPDPGRPADFPLTAGLVRILAGWVRYAFIVRLAAFLNGRRAAPQLAICSAPSVGYGQLLSR